MSYASTELSYLRLYADANGVSHFSEEKCVLTSAGATTGEAKLPMFPLKNAQGATFVALRRDAVEDWHTAPRRQFLIALRGLVEVTAGDGQVRQLKPGDIMLVEDTFGTGHITRSVGTEDHVVIAVPVPLA